MINSTQKIAGLLLSLILLSCAAKTQVIYDEELATLETTIEYLNTFFYGDCEINYDKGELIISYYNKGFMYREDHTVLSALNSKTVVYSSDEKLVIAYCIRIAKAGQLTGCVKQTTFIKKTLKIRSVKKEKKSNHRITFNLREDKHKIKKFSTALSQLITMGHLMELEKMK